MENTIFLGVVSGVLTSALLWFTYKVCYKKICLPWFEAFLYKGIMINGKWANKESDVNDTYEMILDIEQNAYKIKGTFFTKSKSDKHDINYYIFNGEIMNQYVVASYKVTSNKKLEMGTLLLRIESVGKNLNGTIAFIDDRDMGIATFDKVKFSRI